MKMKQKMKENGRKKFAHTRRGEKVCGRKLKSMEKSG